MPNVEVTVDTRGLSDSEVGREIERQLEKAKRAVVKRYVTPPDFSDSYATRREANGYEVVVRLPYKFREAPELKGPSAPRARRRRR